MIRLVKLSDADSIVEIYNYYIENTIITFEEVLISSDEMKSRISEISDSGLPWLVYMEDNVVLGYAYASKWKGRCAYKFSVEITIYISPLVKSKGIGSKLYEKLLIDLKESDIHVVIGGISLPNPASIALHEKFGMEKIAHFKQVGFKFDEWIDVGYWQLILDA
ncbi:MAG: L-amino acid N-acyltransferase YncA [Polaribacter sp.]|jgi:L-amino acid N-acyltransferase YncA